MIRRREAVTIRVVSGDITPRSGSGEIALAEGVEPTPFWKQALK